MQGWFKSTMTVISKALMMVQLGDNTNMNLPSLLQLSIPIEGSTRMRLDPLQPILMILTETEDQVIIQKLTLDTLSLTTETENKDAHQVIDLPEPSIETEELTRP